LPETRPASAQTSLKDLPIAGGFSPRIGRKASLWNVMNSGPHTSAFGNVERSINARVVFRTGGHSSIGPNDVEAQSKSMISREASPPALRKR
jgi:hypothetical protein